MEDKEEIVVVERDRIIEILYSVLEADEAQVDNIKDEEDLCEFGLNSISSVDLVVTLEEMYDIMYDDDDLLLDNLNTINKIMETTNKYIVQEGA